MGRKHERQRGVSTRRLRGLAAATAPVLLSGPWALAQEPVILDQITVEGDPEAVTEGSESYAWERVTVGGKQPQATRDIPQTVSVLSRQAIDDTGADSLEEASRLLPSLTEATGDGFVGSLYTRGQEVFQYHVDGAPRPFLSIYGTAPDLFFFDRVEVMSGPSGVFQGSGEPVGTLNLVRKRPTERLQALAGASGDTEGSYRAEGDVGGALVASGRIRGRLALYGEHEESFVAITERDALGGFGTLEFDLGERTTLSVGGILEYSETLRFSGLPTFSDGRLVDVPRDTFIGSTDNSADIPTREGFVELEHDFGYGGVLKATGRVFDQTADLRNLLGLTGVDPATGDFDVFWFARDFEQTAYYGDVNLTSPLAIAGRPVEVVAGADYRRVEQAFQQTFDFSPGTVTIASFDPTAFPVPDVTFPGVGPGFRLNTESTVDEFGLYAQGRIAVTDRLKLTLGGRLSLYDSTSLDTGRGIVTETSETNVAPYAGLTYDVLDTVTAYASYAEIFQPQIETDVTGATLEPRIGRQVEIGAKSEHFGGALTAQGAWFFIRDENRALPDAVNPGAFTASGEADTRGVELLVSGSPYPGVEIIGGYAHVDTDLANDPTPANTFSLFGKYSFVGGALDGLSLGAGVRAVSGFDNVDGDVLIEAPGYAVFDAFIGYDVSETVSAQVNLFNLTDRTYVERINTTARGTYFGRPLTAVFSLKARF